MVINNDFEMGYLLVAFALLGIILIGTLLDSLHLEKLHPRLLGATLGALLGFALIEAMPLFT
jgi:UDP-N-acetylmuramyl pentapeptide phosphotransferase/UDP-N-acetylglucosamine-1-phosphate transferase